MATIPTLNKSIFTPSLYQRICELWFGNLPWGAKTNTEEALARWFTASKEAKAKFDSVCHEQLNHAIRSISPSEFPIKGLSDAEIAAPFLTEINAADEGGEESTKTALSLIILLDQIPRNLYRAEDVLKLVYDHYDPIASSLARHIVTSLSGQRLDLHSGIRHSLPYRQWFYMPLMHSERLSDHKIMKEVLKDMREEHNDDEEVVKTVAYMEGFEDMHFKIIEQFGRYPYRNKYLGRESTSEEKTWMEKGGASFGVGG